MFDTNKQCPECGTMVSPLSHAEMVAVFNETNPENLPKKAYFCDCGCWQHYDRPSYIPLSASAPAEDEDDNFGEVDDNGCVRMDRMNAWSEEEDNFWVIRKDGYSAIRETQTEKPLGFPDMQYALKIAAILNIMMGQSYGISVNPKDFD